MSLAILYTAVVAFTYFYQPHLVYYPSDEEAGIPAHLGIPFNEIRFRSGSATLHAWYIKHPEGTRLVLFSHGNAGNITHRLATVKLLYGLKCDIFMYDYRGFGRSSGTPSEQGTYTDLRSAWRHVTSTLNYRPHNIILMGRSLGGAVTAELAREVTPGGVILESTFTSMPDLAADIYWYLPVRLLIRFSYNTAAKISHIRAPLLVIHSVDDELIPFSHGEALFKRAKGPKEFLAIRGSHNRGFLTSRQIYRSKLAAFFTRTAPPRQGLQ